MDCVPLNDHRKRRKTFIKIPTKTMAFSKPAQRRFWTEADQIPRGVHYPCGMSFHVAGSTGWGSASIRVRIWTLLIPKYFLSGFAKQKSKLFVYHHPDFRGQKPSPLFCWNSISKGNPPPKRGNKGWEDHFLSGFAKTPNFPQSSLLGVKNGHPRPRAEPIHLPGGAGTAR